MVQEYNICYKLFNEFCSKLYKRHYVLSPTFTQKNKLKKFIVDFKLETGALDFELLFRYISFQFNYWSTLDYNKRSGIEIDWIFGKKAIDRWKKKPLGYYFYVERDFVKKFNINQKSLELLFNKIEKNSTGLKDWEEDIKKKKFNTELGFSYCIDNTSLYNKESSLCLSCNNSESCKEMLKSLYPNIYKKRYE